MSEEDKIYELESDEMPDSVPMSEDEIEKVRCAKDLSMLRDLAQHPGWPIFLKAIGDVEAGWMEMLLAGQCPSDPGMTRDEIAMAIRMLRVVQGVLKEKISMLEYVVQNKAHRSTRAIHQIFNPRQQGE